MQIIFLAFLSLWLVLGSPVFAALGQHDVTPVTNNQEGPCAECHNIFGPQAATRGWGRSTTGAPTTGWFARAITTLCWTCHNSSSGVGAHDVTSTAMSLSNHSYVIANAPAGAKVPSDREVAFVRSSTLPYTSGGNFLECTSCHNVHNNQYRPFLAKPGINELCSSCHPGRNTSAIRSQNVGVGLDNISVHPVDITVTDNTGGFTSIKTLSEMDNALKTPLTLPDNTWRLGGKLSQGDSGNITCATCHAVHGPAGGGGGIENLLAIDNKHVDPSFVNNPLCEGCHYGGLGGGSVGAPGAQDHPMDDKKGKDFYPSGVAIPVDWTGSSDPPRLDDGASVLNSAGRPRCSSCHDSHGGLGGTSLKRNPIPIAAGTEWCWSCHASSPSSAAPAGHHSANGIDNSPSFVSQVTCDMCHFQGLSGHNGFFASFVVPSQGFTTPRGIAVSANDVRDNQNSSLCLYCHRDDDPLAWRDVYGHADNTVMNSMPRIHGTQRGSGSHYLGLDTDTFAGVDLKIDAWTVDNDNAVSKYGTGPTVICESCHSILYNDGSIHPASYPGIDNAFAGWWTNLLLKPYEDDTSGTGQEGGLVGSELCQGCHGNSAPVHHPMTGDIVPYTGVMLKTGAGSLADQPGAPGTLSYPAVDKMDCDSCHRPHSADTDSDLGVGTRLGNGIVLPRDGNLVLELDGPGNDWAILCMECHSK